MGLCPGIFFQLLTAGNMIVVILVGNIHNNKHIVWAPAVSDNSQYLAGRFIQEGVKVYKAIHGVQRLNFQRWLILIGVLLRQYETGLTTWCLLLRLSHWAINFDRG
jgi:hypothetical protein